MRPLALLLLLALATCGSKPELPKPTGQWEPLNPDKQTADVNSITTAPPESGRR